MGEQVTITLPAEYLPVPALMVMNPPTTAPEGTSKAARLIRAAKVWLKANPGATIHHLAGPFTLTQGEVSEWAVLTGLDPEGAVSWSRWGFTPRQAQQWMNVGGVMTGHTAYVMHQMGAEPATHKMLTRSTHTGELPITQLRDVVETMRQLRELGERCTQASAAKWVAEKWDPAAAAALIHAGVSLEQAGTAYAAGLHHWEYIVKWRESGMPLEWMVAWVQGQDGGDTK